MMRVFTFGYQFLFLSFALLIFANSTGYADTIVNDSDKQELVTLKNAVEGLFQSRCPEIQTTSTKTFSIDLQKCLPEKISHFLTKKTSSLGGPNCFNFALNILGFSDSLYMTLDRELNDLYFSKDSLFCSEVSRSAKRIAGEFISTGLREVPSHGFIFLTEKYALSKNGPSIMNQWEITTNKEILSTWAGGDWSNEFVRRYRCKKPSTQFPLEIESSIEHLTNFSKDLVEFQMQNDLAGDSLVKLKSSVYKLSNELTKEKLQTLAHYSDNPFVKIKIYELIGNFYPIQKLHNYLEFYQEYKNPQAAEFFGPAVLVYIKIIEEFLEFTIPNTYQFEMLAQLDSVSPVSPHCKDTKFRSKMCKVLAAELKKILSNSNSH